jgi:hypothetical protein
MSKPPLVPANYKLTKEILRAEESPLIFQKKSKFKGLGKQIPAFNGSQNNRNNKKTPITLPKVGKFSD